jgi:hypothetical protein
MLKSIVLPPSGDQGKYVDYVSCPWHPLEAPPSVLNLGLFLVKKKLVMIIN